MSDPRNCSGMTYAKTSVNQDDFPRSLVTSFAQGDPAPGKVLRVLTGKGDLRSKGNSINPTGRQGRAFSGGAVLTAQFGFLGGEGEKGLFQRAGSTALKPQFFAGAEGDEAALMDDADAVGHFFGDAELVG